MPSAESLGFGLPGAEIDGVVIQHHAFPAERARDFFFDPLRRGNDIREHVVTESLHHFAVIVDPPHAIVAERGIASEAQLLRLTVAHPDELIVQIVQLCGVFRHAPPERLRRGPAHRAVVRLHLAADDGHGYFFPLPVELHLTHQRGIRRDKAALLLFVGDDFGAVGFPRQLVIRKDQRIVEGFRSFR